MSNPIRVTYQYNCGCREDDEPPVTSQPYPIEIPAEGFDSSATLEGARLFDPYLFLTSHPYPIECIEEFQSAGALQKAYVLQGIVEGFNGWAILVADVPGTSGTKLTYVWKEYKLYPPEGFDSWAVLESSKLQEIFRTYDNDLPEGFDGWAILESASLERIFVRTDMAPEGFDSWAVLEIASLEFFP